MDIATHCRVIWFNKMENWKIEKSRFDEKWKREVSTFQFKSEHDELQKMC